MRDSKGLLRYSLEEPKGISLRDSKEFLRESFCGVFKDSYGCLMGSLGFPKDSKGLP